MSVWTMSSEILTDHVRLTQDTTETNNQAPLKTEDSAGKSSDRADQRLQPWQFFVLVALGLATATTFVVRGQGVIPVVMLSVLMGTTALAGMAALRLLRPLVTDEEDRTPMIGERTRAALEREKVLALRAIKELDFDRAMGKVSESDWTEMSGRLRARAARLIRQLDAGSGYRERIERDIARRLASDESRSRSRASTETAAVARTAAASVLRVCSACSIANDADARFCKNCGQKLDG
jgi:hypothetical protein